MKNIAKERASLPVRRIFPDKPQFFKRSRFRVDWPKIGKMYSSWTACPEGYY
jgi:hypothetical protein